jgi:CRISPR/Cas system-associated protein Cas10 (large subunit of type III CRISPR-Cas system)
MPIEQKCLRNMLKKYFVNTGNKVFFLIWEHVNSISEYKHKLYSNEQMSRVVVHESCAE